MRSLSDTVNLFNRSAVTPDAIRALFPELAGIGRAPLVEGLLCAPLRRGAASTCLSLVPRSDFGGCLPPGVSAPSPLLAESGWEEPALLARAAAARRSLAELRLGGAWRHGYTEPTLPAESGRIVVVLPDLAGRTGVPHDNAAEAMLRAAFARHAAAQIVVLAAAPRPRSAPQLAEAKRRGAAIFTNPIDPWRAFDGAERVYAAGGETGFLALVAGIQVSAFAPAFYTGWGLTEDAAGLPQHRFRRTLDELVAAFCLLATRYRDPFHNIRTSFEEALATLAEWRRLEANRRIAVCVGMSFWKRRRVADFLRSSAGAPSFRRTTGGALAAARRAEAGQGVAIAGWASRLPTGLAEAAARQDIPLVRVEDGFIRSVGLGSDFLPPASLVCDGRGMYYDPRQPSDLEILLAETAFPPELLARGRHLADRLVARGISKYNLAGSAGPQLSVPAGARVILVPGQVEDDLSVRFGGGHIRSNLALLQAVRAANPGALILYKPHPDVLAGHRKGAVPNSAMRRYADRLVSDIAMPALLARVDEIHTMTSLAGFEALLRGRRVTVYGRPFYAGWGLTEDKLPLDRGRRLSLDELVAGVLILYPRYLDPLTRLPCGPEIVVERLDDPELWRAGPLVTARRLQGALVRRLGGLGTMLSNAGLAPARGLRERLRP